MMDSLEKLQSEVKLWKSRALEVKNEYDVLRSNKLRRTPRVETTGEGGILTAHKRGQAANLGRDIERNYPSGRAIIHQFRSNVVGSLGKMQVNTERGEDAAAWFNEEWARNCDMRDDTHWSDICGNVVTSALREGDVLSVFDDRLLENSGKLLLWEADQVVPMTESLATELGYPVEKYIQDNGIIRDKRGVVVAYVVTGKRGITTASSRDEVTIFPRESAMMPRSPWRLNQGRGVGPMLTCTASLLDVYEMLMRELQSATRAAAQYGYVKREAPVMDWDDPTDDAEFLTENDGKTAATVATESAGGTEAARNYENLEEFTGGLIDYMQVGDAVDFPKIDRPNIHMQEFIESVLCQCGAAFGLARAYSLMRADSSYTSFRGDMIMSWQGAFYPMQKWLERSFADRVGVKALQWAQDQGKIPRLSNGWERRISWIWPTMPEVNETDAETSVALALKNGTTDYSKLLGPDWRKRLSSLAEQIEIIRKLGLPLSVLEMKSGGAASNNKPEEQGDKDEQN